jgi:hypothetical protein
MKHVMEFDKSEGIIPHGEVSKHLYLDILNGRLFDLYGAKFQREMMSDKEEQEIALVARRMGIDYRTTATAKAEVGARDVRFIDIYGKRGVEELKRPAITTPYFRIGLKEHYNPPVGFSKAPKGSLNSEGNEQYYSYDGAWQNGKMHGWGYYLYEDGGAYEGEFKNNWQEGEGTSRYVYRAPKEPKHGPGAAGHDHFPVNPDDKKAGGTVQPEDPHIVPTSETSNSAAVVPHADNKESHEVTEAKVGALSGEISLASGNSAEVVTGSGENVDEVKGEDSDADAEDRKKHEEPHDEPGQNPTVYTHKYVGQWKKGRFHGYGTQFSSMGHDYTGEFYQAKREVLLILEPLVIIKIVDFDISIQNSNYL